jgi:hypothetical protein
MYRVTNATLRDYDPEAFQRLNTFRVAKQSLVEQQKCIADLGDIICSHQLNNHVGGVIASQAL